MTQNKEIKKNDVDNTWIEEILTTGSKSKGSSLQIEEALLGCFSDMGD